jgi:hypothetical protein
MIQLQKGWRAREKAAEARRKRRLVSPEVRAQRAALLQGFADAQASDELVVETEAEKAAREQAEAEAAEAARLEAERVAAEEALAAEEAARLEAEKAKSKPKKGSTE